jgi:hypothetical protein
MFLIASHSRISSRAEDVVKVSQEDARGGGLYVAKANGFGCRDNP